MDRLKDDLLVFIAGLAMLIAGLFILSQKVMVRSGFFGGGISLGGFQIGNGLIMVPFIAGIVWMFASGGKIGSKILTGIGIFIIVVAIVLSTNISMVTMTLFDWVVILVLIFGGSGLVIRALATK